MRPHTFLQSRHHPHSAATINNLNVPLTATLSDGARCTKTSPLGAVFNLPEPYTARSLPCRCRGHRPRWFNIAGSNLRSAEDAALSIVWICSLADAQPGTRNLFRAPQITRGHKLRVRAESKQPAVTILDDKLPRSPRHLCRPAGKYHTLGRQLGVKRVCVVDEEIRIE